MKEEIWKPIVGYENLYEVSNLGKVRSVDREVYRIQNGSLVLIRRKGRILKPGHTRGEYEICRLSKDGVGKFKRINRLVAEAFLPNPKNLPQVNHKNEIKTDNRVDNLEWCTQEYNVNYGTGIQRRSISRGKKIKVDGVEYYSLSEAARYLNCRSSALSDALIRNRTTYKNHKIEEV